MLNTTSGTWQRGFTMPHKGGGNTMENVSYPPTSEQIEQVARGLAVAVEAIGTPALERWAELTTLADLHELFHRAKSGDAKAKAALGAIRELVKG